MSLLEETIDATLDASGQLQLSHPPSVAPGPVQVTIRVAQPAGPKHLLSDVIREIAARQRASGFPGRSDAEIQAFLDERAQDDEDRDRLLDAARSTAGSGRP